jgi:hypothetical protein
MKSIKFLIKSGHYLANNLFRFRFIAGSSITFSFKLSHSAYYNYRDIINSWHHIIGFSDFPLMGNGVVLVFKNSSSGLKAGFTFLENNCVKEPFYFSDHKLFTIIPEIEYKVSVIRNNDSFEVFFHDEPRVHSIFSMMSRPLLKLLFVMHPGLKGMFTLEKDLNIYIKYEKNIAYKNILD